MGQPTGRQRELLEQLEGLDPDADRDQIEIIEDELFKTGLTTPRAGALVILVSSFPVQDQPQRSAA